MGTIEIVVGIILAIIFLVAVVLLTRKWGKKFLFIVLTGFVVYVLSADPGVGIGISLIIILSYLAKKNGDFKKI